eukprot:gb/GECH01011982.1/.p1 GENE.gb/GECH01011982.1/~~gb/GECH01011982.1/.p1  ORF type:complete len:128 (+),score=41.04 gb/GECH01011982.1/:1-384(+)
MSSSGSDYSSDEELTPTPPKSQSNPKFSLKVKPKSSIGESMKDFDKELLGSDVKFLFKLPDGETLEETFKMGHQVDFVKYTLCEKTGLGFENVKLDVQGEELADPLSLNDIGVISPDEVNTVNVTKK